MSNVLMQDLTPPLHAMAVETGIGFHE